MLWVRRDLGQTYIAHRATDKKTRESNLRRIQAALNTCIRFQNDFLNAVFGTRGSLLLSQEVLSCKDSIIKHSRSSVRKWGTGNYVQTKSATDNRKTLVQMDVQRDHVDEPLSDAQLMYSYFTTHTRASTCTSVEVRFTPSMKLTQLVRGILNVVVGAGTTGIVTLWLRPWKASGPASHCCGSGSSEPCR